MKGFGYISTDVKRNMHVLLEFAWSLTCVISVVMLLQHGFMLVIKTRPFYSWLLPA
jgi:hypothetical protein